MNETKRRRLAALESKLIRPPEPPRVDLEPFLLETKILCVACHSGKKRKNESVLTAFARALGVTPTRLWRLVSKDRKQFRKRYVPFESVRAGIQPGTKWWAGEYERREAEADKLADYVMRKFMAEECVFQLLEHAFEDEDLWWFEHFMGDPKSWGLCLARPCKPLAPPPPGWLTLWLPGVRVVAKAA